MPTRKISEENKHTPCFHPDHNPPSMQVFEPGTYEHECSGCGAKKVFVVKGIYLSRGGVQLPPKKKTTTKKPALEPQAYCRQVPECECGCRFNDWFRYGNNKP